MSDARLRILEDGSLEIVDPKWEDAELLRAIEPAFAIRTATLPGFEAPRFAAMRMLGNGLSLQEVAAAGTERLWEAHASALDRWKHGKAGATAAGEGSILDLKRVLTRRLLKHCVLCARRCGVDRMGSERGFCKLGKEAILAESFIHIGEEPPINPSHLFSLAGCALRCRFCQQAALLVPEKASGKRLAAATWNDVDITRARSVSFIGGNPDESLASILDFLNEAPAHISLPVVWNTHAYSSPEALTLLDGIADVYIPDLKYGNDRCAEQWSLARDYYSVARKSIEVMTAQAAAVIVRMLLLPGHMECCHEPALTWLASLSKPPQVSIRAQYSPDWLIRTSDGLMAGRVSRWEFNRALQKASSLGLTQVLL